MRSSLIGTILILANLFLVGCSQADMDGIIIKVSDKQVLVATELSLDEYEKIKKQSAAQIQNSDVLGDAYYGLIDLTYEDAESFTPGNLVEVWIEGPILESYPLQAKAKKIAIKVDSVN